MEISADYTDYVRGIGAVCEKEGTLLGTSGFFAPPNCTLSDRNLRNLCNLRILKQSCLICGF
jgi:hypothetical protein